MAGTGIIERVFRKVTGRKAKATESHNAPKDLSFIQRIEASPFFDARWYVEQYPQVTSSGLKPAEHYYWQGAEEGLNPSPAFDTQFYLERYPDVAETGMNPLLHFVLHGLAEGRHPREDRLSLLDDKLWSGHAPTALKELESILNDATEAATERHAAAWHIARYQVFCGNYKTGLVLAEKMAELLPEQRMAKNRILLEACCYLKLEQQQTAGQLLEAYLALNPNDVDCRLMLANALDSDDERLKNISEAYERQGFLGIERLDASKPLSFFNLGSNWAQNAFRVPEAEQTEKITIIMPIFNAEERIEVAVRSLLNQTWRNIEVIAVDDCSTDRTVEVLQRIASQDDRLKVVQQPQNAGAYPARNRGLKEATGNLVTTHDADDWSHPQKLEQQVLLLREQPQAQGVILNWVRATGDLHFTINWRPSDRIVHYSHSSFMLKKEAINAIGQWDEVRIGADTELIWRAQHHFGKESIIHGNSGVPFAFALDEEGSLTRTKATHVSTVYYGLRHVYREICRWYHREGLDPTAKTIIPRAMTSKSQDWRAFDLLVVADFASKPSSNDLLEQVRNKKTPSQKIALLHWPAFGKRQHRVCDNYFELLHDGLAEPVVFGDNIVVSDILVANGELLMTPVVALPDFKDVKTVNVVKTDITEEEKKQAERNACELFGTNNCVWVNTLE
ncbi:glycosyltransferase family A protein [Idiomarina sp.]|uniref:glycosyltransferase family A protein n=1 Tax=Idiomarina sp. TaxID=1874361 RepID=UPI0026283BE6|nr:glycosyltransferase family A protein [Idiomarina sp.]